VPSLISVARTVRTSSDSSAHHDPAAGGSTEVGAGKRAPTDRMSAPVRRGDAPPPARPRAQPAEPGVAVAGGLGDTEGLYDDVVARVRTSAATADRGADDEAAAPTPESVNYVFYFAGGDAYGRAAHAFMEANYSDYRRRPATSIEQMFSILHAELTGPGSENLHVGHIILVSHASIEAPSDDEAGAAIAGELYIAPTAGSDQRLSAESLAALQAEFRQGLHARFRRRRSALVGEAIDENTTIEIRACRIGQSAETMAAIRDLFGGAAEVVAPTGYQGYGLLPMDASMPLADRVAILIEQGSLPPSAASLPTAEQEAMVATMTDAQGRLATQHFIADGPPSGDGRTDRQRFEALPLDEQIEQLATPGAGDLASRDEVAAPAIGDAWERAPDDAARDDLAGLPRQELEARARALLARYQPGLAVELQQLRAAWLMATLLDDDLPAHDPLAGLAPDDVFGDPGVIDRDARRSRGERDRFEEATIAHTPPTPRQQGELAEGPDQVSVAPGEPEIEAAIPAAAPARRRRARPRAAAPASTEGEAEPLFIVDVIESEIVFNRVASRAEVTRYLWGGRFTPGMGELSGDDVMQHPTLGELDLGGTDRWTLPRTLFAARPEAFSRMRPDIRERLATAPSASAAALTRPHWIPGDVWQRFMATHGNETFRYTDRSPILTDIVLIRREGRVAAYMDAQEREAILFSQMRVVPPDRLHELLGVTSIDQRLIHLLAHANAAYNAYMWSQVTVGVDPSSARHAYPQAVFDSYLRAYVSVVGFMGSMAPSWGNVPIGSVLDEHYLGND
jgi:hypothetical protein